MYDIEMNKRLMSSHKNKTISFFTKKKAHRIQIYNQKLVLSFPKCQQIGAKTQIYPKMTLNYQL